MSRWSGGDGWCCQRRLTAPHWHGLLEAFVTTSATANHFPYNPQSEGAGDHMDDKKGVKGSTEDAEREPNQSFQVWFYFFTQLIPKRQRAEFCCWGGTGGKLPICCRSVMGENQCTASVVSTVGLGSSAPHQHHRSFPPARYAMANIRPAQREELFHPLHQWQNRGREEESGYFSTPLFFLFSQHTKLGSVESPASVSCVVPANKSTGWAGMPLPISLQNRVFNNLFIWI